jgi:hypothetical protein
MGERGVTMETAQWRRGVLHGHSTMGERGVTMDTVLWGRGVLPWRQYNREDGCYHGYSTMGERGVTMKKDKDRLQ